MRRRGWLASAVAAVLLAAGCGTLAEGYVVSKYHRPSATTVTMTCIAQPNGTCTMVPITSYTPECWSITVQHGEDTGSWCLTNAEWHAVEVGDYWSSEQGA